MTLRTSASDFAATAPVILAAMAFALGVGYLVAGPSDETFVMRENRRYYVKLHHCTVVSMERRRPSMYRCEVPEKAYLSTKELRKLADDFAAKNGPVPESDDAPIFLWKYLK